MFCARVEAVSGFWECVDCLIAVNHGVDCANSYYSVNQFALGIEINELCSFKNEIDEARSIEKKL